MQIRIPLTPKQRELAVAIENYPNTFYGGAKGGGKSHGLRSIMLWRRFKYPGSVGYIFRKTYKELQANHISRILKQWPQLSDFYYSSEHVLKIPNGSELYFAHCESERDLGKYQGVEIHDLAIEEAGEWPFEFYDTLKTCNRSGLPGVSPKTILTGNPGGVGHKWLKRLFISKEYEGREKASDYHFIPAKVSDNPALAVSDPEYAERLAGMKNEMLRKAYLDGDWDIEAGQFFGEFRRTVHVVPDFKIPDHWPRIWGYDWGFAHPMALTCLAADEQGTLYLYREFSKAKMYIDEAADQFKRFPDFKKAGLLWAGRDCWVTKNAQSKSSEPTIADQFRSHGVILKPANVARVSGAAQLRVYLRYIEHKDPKLAVAPKLKIFESCSKTINCIARLIHDPNEPEDVLKEDATESDENTGDDLYDSLRYGLMSRPRLAVPPRPTRGSDRRYERVIEESSDGSWKTA